MKKFGLKLKLALLGFIPLAVVVFLSANVFYQDFTKVSESKKLLKNVEYMNNSSIAVHYLQIERGTSIGFLNGGETLEYIKKIQNKNFSHINKVKEDLKLAFFEKKITESILNNYKEFLKVRKNVLTNEATTQDVFTAYTNLIHDLLKVEDVVERTSSNVYVSEWVRVLKSLEEAKESGGIFRAKFSGLLAAKKPVSTEALHALEERIYFMQSLVDGRTVQFTEDLNVHKKNILGSIQWKNMWETVEQTRKEKETGEFSHDSHEFFENISYSLNIVNKMIELSRKQLKITLEKSIVTLNSRLIFFGSGLIIFALIISIVVFVVSRSIASSLSEIVHQLNNRSSTLSSSSMQVTDASGELSESANEQAEALHQTVTAIDEISAMVNKNSESASKSQDMSVKCNQVVGDGQDYVHQVEQAIEDIKNMNEEIVSEMTKSNDEFAEIIKVISEISEKTQVINDIVFQTKLLSFNASVEAARAGEHGKGFAVVAEEVGNLASMSGKAADEITGMLEGSVKKVEQIVNETKVKVDSMMTNARDKVSSGQKTVEQCTGAFAQISENVSSMNSMISEIAAASREQALGVAEVSDAVNGLDQITQKTTLVSRQTKEIATSLTSQSDGMNEVVDGLQDIMYGEGERAKLIIDEFEWSEDYLIKVKDMDDEHIVLVDYINLFIASLNKDNSSSKVSSFKAMADYTIEHFSHEEKFLQSINYPEFNAHKRIHTRLLSQVQAYGEELEAGTLDEQKLVAFLKNWLVSHIMGVDTKYADHYINGPSSSSRSAA